MDENEKELAELIKTARGIFLDDDRWAPISGQLETRLASEPTPGLESEHYELLAFDALKNDAPGYAYACIEWARTLAGPASARQGPLAQLRDEILRRHFPPYDDESACLLAIRNWARARLASRSLGHPDTVVAESTRLQQRWWLRLLHTRQRGTTFALDELAKRFDLNATETTLLRILAALHWDQTLPAPRPGGRLTVGDLGDLVLAPDQEPEALFRAFDGRAPLLANALVSLSEAGPLRERAVDIDHAIMAYLQGESWWSPEMAAQVSALRPDQNPAPAYLNPTLTTLSSSLNRADQPVVHLSAQSTTEARFTLATWSAANNRPVWVISRAPSPALSREIRRAALLSQAVLWVDASSLRPDTWSAWLDVPVVQLQPSPPEGRPVLSVGVATPAAEERPLLWNEALYRLGYPALNPADLTEHLGELTWGYGAILVCVASVDASPPTASDLARTATRLSEPGEAQD